MKTTHLSNLSKLALLLMLILGTSCVPQKKLLYMRGADSLHDFPQKVEENFELTIQPDDQLSIAIASKDEELIAPFNTKAYIGMGSKTGGGMSVQNGLSYFPVDNNGTIEFPILGTLHVEGMNHKEVEDLIEKLLIDGNHIKDPQVTVKIMSFKVNVLGEVASPGVKQLTGERLTLLEAIGLAGDLLPTAKRNNILVLREENGERTTYHVDLTSSSEVLNSPVYYLQQNDVIYVQPNKSLGLKSSSTLAAISSFSGIFAMLLSIASIIISATN